MKAWIVGRKDDFYSEIIFAETRGKASSLALSTDCCEDADFCDIEVRRMPQADKYYKQGKWHLDWDIPQDRIVLVNECGFTCNDEYFDLEECENCSAKEYCCKYQDFLESEVQEDD